MQNNPNTNIEHIIAKIDNDFNLDHTDYIPRIAAWVIEVLSILKCAKYEKVIKKINVTNKIVNTEGIDLNNITVYDRKLRIIQSMQDVLKEKHCCCGDYIGRDEQIAVPVDPTKYPEEYVTTSRNKCCKDNNKYYVVVNANQLELNFEADFIYIEYKAVKTEKSTLYNCELPVIPNNGVLIEAIVYYCMYKILCRGHKHPVMNLNASQYGTNPYYMWLQLKDQAKRSVIIDEQGEVIDDGGQWRESFYNFTFNPKG